MSSSNRKFEFLLPESQRGDDPRSLPAGALWHGFMDHTTAHGISHWNNSRGCLKKSYWLLFSLGSVAAMLYYGYGIVEKFRGFPVTVTVSVNHEAELTFPAITFCNSNPIRASAMLHDAYLSGLLGIESEIDDTGENGDAVGNGTDKDVGGTDATVPTEGTTQSNGGITEGMETIGPKTKRRKKRQEPSGGKLGFPANMDLHQKDSQQKTNDKGRAIKADFALSLQFQQYVAELTVPEKSAMGHPIEDFILQCHYGGYTCNASDFYSFYNTKYGNCFVFNSGWEEGTELEVSRTPGPEYGLEVIFNIDQNEYIGEFTSVAGVRLVVHDQDSMPFPEDEGVTFQPGALTFVGLRKETIERKGHPYGNCTDISDENSEYSSVYEEFFPVSYTTKACLKTCVQKSNIDSCHCADSKYPIYGEAFGYKRVPICDLTNDTQSDCVEAVLELYKHGELKCDCPTACSESLFTTEISSGLWPANQYKDGLFSELSDTSSKAQLVIREGTYHENFAKVIVYYEEFNLEAIKEIPSYQAGQFVSDIGGILGLFIGFSLLTIMEFVELFIDLMVLCCYKCCGKSPTAPSITTTTSEDSSQSDDRRRMFGWSPPPSYNSPVKKNTSKTPIQNFK